MAGVPDLVNSPMCFGCGKQNDAGLQLDFELLEDGRLRTSFVPRDIHGGWEGVFHGGLMATLLDEAMMAYVYRNGMRATTGSLEIRFRHPVELGDELLVHAWMEERRGRLMRMAATAERGGVTVASATSKCLLIEEPDKRGA